MDQEYRSSVLNLFDPVTARLTGSKRFTISEVFLGDELEEPSRKMSLDVIGTFLCLLPKVATLLVSFEPKALAKRNAETV